MIDVGGGSTELILGDTEPRGAHSMDIGSVRLHERHLRDDPPTEEQVTACVADIDAALDACPVDPAAAATVVGIAGTVTTVAAGVLDLPAYDRDAIDQQVLRVEDVHAMVDRIVAMPVAQPPGPALPPPRSGRRHRRRGADPLAGAAPRAHGHDRGLRGRHPRRDRLVARWFIADRLPGPVRIPDRHDRSGDAHHLRSSRSARSSTGSSEQLPELVRSEMRLAQAELTEKGKAAGPRRRALQRCGHPRALRARDAHRRRHPGPRPGAAGLGRRADRRGGAARRGRHRGADREEGGQRGHPAGPGAGHRRGEGRRRDTEGDTTHDPHPAAAVPRTSWSVRSPSSARSSRTPSTRCRPSSTSRPRRSTRPTELRQKPALLGGVAVAALAWCPRSLASSALITPIQGAEP